jgi:V/A-type H+-transporting ATPase subunit E
MSGNEIAGNQSHGIQELVDTLHQDGVAAGREQGQRVVAEAETRAQWIIDQAKREAEQLRQQAATEAAFIRQAGKEALELAYRDTMLKLKDQLLAQFSENLRRLVSQELTEADLLSRLILSIVGDCDLPAGPADIELPAQAAAVADIGQHPEMLKGDALVGYVSDLTANMLRDGVSLGVGRQGAGLVIHLREDNIKVELTDEVVAELLLSFLQPRFRALLEGVVA